MPSTGCPACASCPTASVRPRARLAAHLRRRRTVRLDVECRGFPAVLENAGILDAECREMIVRRALALGETEIELENLKVIVLMVLWQQDRPINGLILDELLNESDEDDDEAGSYVRIDRRAACKRSAGFRMMRRSPQPESRGAPQA